MNFLERLKNRWNLSLTRVVLVLIVFSLTGITVMLLKTPVLEFIEPDSDSKVFFSIAYYILIWPIYNAILLFYGLIFGQFHFFWNFEKKMWYRMTRRKQDESTQ